ncbi:hypothetical protein EDC45_1690 [Mesocricetibacter intestinalis]|uniref:Uncharacterized protein n=2 Tax=Mesocricetibacter intestinalis TaxID=1521930 RepID=A0A4R6VAD2_9PAST|nr:hypothetical protein EDC45_1690 [Mesocricetibacter intestinalis]
MHLEDNLTDEASNVNEAYAQAGVTADQYVGKVVAMTDSSKALSLATGLTNDKDAAFSFTLGKPVAAGQSVKVYLYKLGINNTEYNEVDVTAQLGEPKVNDDGSVTYTLTPKDALEDTYNTSYRYKTVIVDSKTGEELTEGTNFDFRLDTLVEQMDVVNMDSDKKTMTLKARDLSELNAIISFKYKDASGELTEAKNVRVSGEGEYVISMPNWDRFHAGSIKIVTVDAAGNVGETDITALRNLWVPVTTQEGVKLNDPPTKGALGIPQYHVDQPLGTSAMDYNKQKVASKKDGGLVSDDGNQSIYLGLDNYDGNLAPESVGIAQLSNGAIGFTVAAAGGKYKRTIVELAGGDDSLHIRGNVLDGSPEGYIDMGDGNNKISVGGSILTAGRNTFKYGSGNDIFELSGSIRGDTLITFDMGEGNNIIRAGGALSGKKTIIMGNGDDSIIVGDILTSGVSGASSTINMGDGNNLIQTDRMSYHTIITFGKDDDTMIVNTVLDDQSTGTISFGDGNDQLVGGNLKGLYEFRMGDGDDKVTITGTTPTSTVDGGTNANGTPENDTLMITHTGSKVSLSKVINFETIDLTAPGSQRIGISIDYINRAKGDATKEIYIKGSSADIVDLGDNGKGISSQVYTSADGVTAHRYKDGGMPAERNWNYWEKIGKVTTDEGITYDKYTHATNQGVQSDEYIFIQQGIQIV